MHRCRPSISSRAGPPARNTWRVGGPARLPTTRASASPVLAGAGPALGQARSQAGLAVVPAVVLAGAADSRATGRMMEGVTRIRGGAWLAAPVSPATKSWPFCCSTAGRAGRGNPHLANFRCPAVGGSETCIRSAGVLWLSPRLLVGRSQSIVERKCCSTTRCVVLLGGAQRRPARSGLPADGGWLNCIPRATK